IHINGQLSGSISLTRSLMSDGTTKVDQVQSFKIIRQMGGRAEPFELTESEAGHYASDFSLLTKTTTRTEGETKTIRTYRVADGKLHFTQTSPGTDISRSFELPDD